MTRPLAQTLDMAISNGVSGKVRRCSMMPCSRSRISAAPVRTTVSVVIWLTRATMAPNQEVAVRVEGLADDDAEGEFRLRVRAVDERVDAVDQDVPDVAGTDAGLRH